jgi:predicted protein tyrosine phosphatase
MLKADGLIVYSRADAAHMQAFDKPWAIISIKNPGMSELKFPTENRVGVLRLDFDDLDYVPHDDRYYVLFSPEMARNVWDFVNTVWEKADTLVVHCNHGVSRSPAIAAAIAKVKFGDDSKWFNTKVPNRRVFKCMLAIASELGMI